MTVLDERSTTRVGASLAPTDRFFRVDADFGRMSGPDTLLEMKNVRKTFPGVVANDHVDFSVRRGEIHGLLGENGAGKSTLMKILYGLYQPDEGEIWFDGRRIDIGSPDDAIEAGIGMVHQHFKLIPTMTVTENVVLGLRESYDGSGADADGAATRDEDLGVLERLRRLFTYDRKRADARVREVATEFGVDIDPEQEVWELEVGERQRVEILKALYRDVDLLILDEPTAVLTPDQIDRLFETLRELSAKGLTIIIITHKLGEVMEITDRTTVLREGEKIDTVDTGTVDENALARMMVGRDVLLDTEKEAVASGDPVLEVEDLHATNDRGIETVSGLSLTVHENEIVGLAGVSGNGQRELSQCLVGTRTPSGGSIRLDGRDLTGEPTRAFIDAGISHVPADRLHEGAAPGLSLVHNGVMKDYRQERFQSGPGGLGMNYDAAREHTERIVEEFDVRVPNVDVDAEDLSGGNLQKLILGRELIRDQRFLVANQPSRGLDVGAIEFVREQILEQRREGSGVLLISEDLTEIMDLSDRIAVVYDGEIIHTTPAETADREELGLYMTGGKGTRRDAETGGREAETGSEESEVALD
jgi:simple sugar transport system ATP-binding protein